MTATATQLCERADLPAAAAAHLADVTTQWQLISDLAFADLLLLVRDTTGGWRVADHVRPYTAETRFEIDRVGQVIEDSELIELADRALADRRAVGVHDIGGVFADAMVPIIFDGQVDAVVWRATSSKVGRQRSKLETAYLDAADELCDMMTVGTFPYAGPNPATIRTPRVGDGLIRLDADGHVLFASPNAVSAARRLGIGSVLPGAALADFDLDAEALTHAIEQKRSMVSEVDSGGVIYVRLLLPLIRGQFSSGALLLMREVTELRSRDRALAVKDVTLREVHHRVKNNLQTIGSLLRMQSRRAESHDVRHALDEATRRVQSMAVVHELLSTDPASTLDIEAVVSELIPVLTAGLHRPDRSIDLAVLSDVTDADSRVVTAIALILSELIANAFEHAFGDKDSGSVLVRISEDADQLVVEVIDDGNGLPDGWTIDAGDSLGLQIVQALVAGDLHGEFTIRDGENGGVCASVALPKDALRPRRRH